MPTPTRGAVTDLMAAAIMTDLARRSRRTRRRRGRRHRRSTRARRGRPRRTPRFDAPPRLQVALIGTAPTRRRATGTTGCSARAAPQVEPLGDDDGARTPTSRRRPPAPRGGAPPSPRAALGVGCGAAFVDALVGGVAVVAVVGALAVGGADRPSCRWWPTRAPPPVAPRLGARVRRGDASEDSMSTKTPTPPHDRTAAPPTTTRPTTTSTALPRSSTRATPPCSTFVSGVLHFDHAEDRRRRGRGRPHRPRPRGLLRRAPRRLRRRRPADPGAAGSGSRTRSAGPISPPFSPPSPPGYNPLAVADCRGRARVVSLGGVPFVCVFDERWSGAALTRQQLERMLAASQPATLAAARKAECAPEESYAIDPLTLAFKDRAVRARFDESDYDAGYAGYRTSLFLGVFVVFALSGAASVERFGLDFGRGPTTTSRCGRSPSTWRCWAGCAADVPLARRPRKYYPSYVTAIYFIGIALRVRNIHMVTRRCPRQPGRMCDQRPIYFTNDAYSDPAIVAALFWFRAVLVIAPALAAAIFRVRFPALAVGTTLTTLSLDASPLGRGRRREEVGARAASGGIHRSPPSIMMVILDPLGQPQGVHRLRLQPPPGRRRRSRAHRRRRRSSTWRTSRPPRALADRRLPQGARRPREARRPHRPARLLGGRWAGGPRAARAGGGAHRRHRHREHRQDRRRGGRRLGDGDGQPAGDPKLLSCRQARRVEGGSVPFSGWCCGRWRCDWAAPMPLRRR